MKTALLATCHTTASGIFELFDTVKASMAKEERDATESFTEYSTTYSEDKAALTTTEDETYARMNEKKSSLAAEQVLFILLQECEIQIFYFEYVLITRYGMSIILM